MVDVKFSPTLLVHKPKMLVSPPDQYMVLDSKKLVPSFKHGVPTNEFFGTMASVRSKIIISKEYEDYSQDELTDMIMNNEIDWAFADSDYKQLSKNRIRLHKKYVKSKHVCYTRAILVNGMFRISYGGSNQFTMTYKPTSVKIENRVVGFSILFTFRKENFYDNSLTIEEKYKFTSHENCINPFTYVWPWDRDDGYYEMCVMESMLKNKRY